MLLFQLHSLLSCFRGFRLYIGWLRKHLQNKLGPDQRICQEDHQCV